MQKEKTTLVVRATDVVDLGQVAAAHVVYLSETQLDFLEAMGQYLKGKGLPQRMTLTGCYSVYAWYCSDHDRALPSKARAFDEIRRLGNDYGLFGVEISETLRPEDTVIAALYDLEEISRALRRAESLLQQTRAGEEMQGEIYESNSEEPMQLNVRFRLEDAWENVSQTVDARISFLNEENKEELKNVMAGAFEAAQRGDYSRFRRAFVALEEDYGREVSDILNPLLDEVEKAAFPHGEE